MWYTGSMKYYLENEIPTDAAVPKELWKHAKRSQTKGHILHAYLYEIPD